MATYLVKLGNMFYAAQLFQGARVLDFGSATGWLARILASAGCYAIGTDVSRIALAAADQFTRRRQPELLLHLEWRLFDGERLDLPDSSLDRILCHDVFHHVPNQLQVLREFRRVLRPDGLAVFSEPGPHHSRSPASQREMRDYGVIENDMIAEEVEAHALAAGFHRVELSLFSLAPVQLPVSDFLAMVQRERPGAPGAANPVFQRLLWPCLAGMRAFVMFPSPIAGLPSSRDPAHCQGEIRVLEWRPQDKGGLGLRLIATNTGTGQWLPSGNSAGAVNIGLQLVKGDRLVNRNLYRHRFLDAPLAPGESVETELNWPHPIPPGHEIRMGLVAELVTWFTMPGLGTLMPQD